MQGDSRGARFCRASFFGRRATLKVFRVETQKLFEILQSIDCYFDDVGGSFAEHLQVVEQVVLVISIHDWTSKTNTLVSIPYKYLLVLPPVCTNHY